MRYTAIFTSALIVGAWARPNNDLEKRKIIFKTVTETDYVNVFVTVADRGVQATSTPKTTPMFSFPDPRTRSRPVFWWSPPKSLTPAPTAKSSTLSSKSSAQSSTPRTSATQPSSTPLSTPRASSTKPSSTPIPSTPRLSSTPIATPSSSSMQPSSSAPKASSTVASSSIRPSSPSPKASIAATPSPSSAVIGPKHMSGESQAYLTPASSDYQNAILYHHNARRANHNASPMTWCSDCADNAKIAAERCSFAHFIPQGVKNGQNLFITNGDVFNVTAAITESWYKSELPLMKGHYGEPTLDVAIFKQVGHLTQIVWRGTMSVGCYSLDCGDRMVDANGNKIGLNKYTVCNYSPPGNVRGKFDVNVLAPLQTTNLGSWTD